MTGRAIKLNEQAWVIVKNEPPMAPSDPPATYVSTWDGQAWRSERVDLGAQSMSNAKPAAQEAWVLLGDRAMRWSGIAWQTAPLHSYGEKVAGTTEEPWVIAEQGDEDVTGWIHLSRWTDRGWQVVSLPAGMTLPPDAEPAHTDDTSTEIAGVARTGPEEFWVAGAFSWIEHQPVDLEDVLASRKLVMRNVAGQWSCWWGPTEVTENPDSFVDAVPDGRGGLWAATKLGMLWHLSDGRWTREQMPVDKGVPMINDLVGSPGGEMYALGGIVSEAWAEDSRPALWRLNRHPR